METEHSNCKIKKKSLASLCEIPFYNYILLIKKNVNKKIYIFCPLLLRGMNRSCYWSPGISAGSGGRGGGGEAVLHQWARWSGKTTGLVMTRSLITPGANKTRLSPPVPLKQDVLAAPGPPQRPTPVRSLRAADPTMVWAAALVMTLVSFVISGEGPARVCRLFIMCDF